MTAHTHERIETLCLEALSRSDSERAAFLDQACGADAELRREVESLLAGRSEAGAFLESPAFAVPAAPLVPGTRLGPYEILAAVGAGGMGEVYKARDTRLDRVVAIKVLRPLFARDADRRARFEREAKTIAGLSHPHICPLFDVGHEAPTEGQAEGGGRKAQAREPVDFLVMEYLEGQTLAARLEKGKLPIEQALAIGAQIADALAAAHRHGIIHRDLKPANVMLVKAPAGGRGAVEAKLLDFGLAKLKAHGEQDVASQLASTPKATLTAEGTIVGTLQYMAPEQLEGTPADARTDLWALGTLLYEMITGKCPFAGTSAPTLMAAILDREPAPLSALQPDVPSSLAHVVTTCLAKDPDARWQEATDVSRELRWVAEESRVSRSSSAGAAPAAPLSRAGLRGRRLLPSALGTVAVVGMVATAWLWRSTAGRPIAPPRLVHLTTMPGEKGVPALSPDGSQVAYVWSGENGDNLDIHVKPVEGTGGHRLTNDPRTDFWPCWSPEGRRVAFVRPDGVYTVSALGGDEQKISDLFVVSRMSWSPDGRWLAASRGVRPGAKPDDAGIYLLPVSGGEPVRVSAWKPPVYDGYPTFSWDGRSLAFVRTDRDSSSELLVQPLTADGRPLGEPRGIVPRRMLIFGIAWHPDGDSIIFTAHPAYMLSCLYRVPVRGSAPPERIELAGLQAQSPSTAPGRHRLVFSDRNINWDICRVGPGGTHDVVIQSSLTDYAPALSPDGRRIAFTTNRNGETTEVWIANADGSNQRQLTHGPGRNQGSPHWSPDSRWLAYDSQNADGSFDIYVIEAAGGQPRRLTSAPSNEQNPIWSRDGQWIYFRSNRSGAYRVWKAPASGGSWRQVGKSEGPAQGGVLESVDGKTLFYRVDSGGGAGEVLAVPLDGGPERRVVDYHYGAIAVSADGIFYWGRTGPDRRRPLLFTNASSGLTTELTRVAAEAVGVGLTVSPDGKTVLFVASATWGGDLMLIENFR